VPLTFLSHQAPVLPLKLAAPRWFDGTALVVGSMAPDLVFVLHGTRWYPEAHAVGAQLWVCLPLTIVLTWVIKRVVAGPLGVHLPDGGPFHLRDYARLASWRLPRRALPWLVLLSSALIGSCSHLVLDSFTHGFGFVVTRVAVLRAEMFTLPAVLSGRTVFVHDLLQLGGTVVGAAITLWCLLVIGRRRLLLEWYPHAPPIRPSMPTTRSRRLLAVGSVAGLVAGLAVAVCTRHVGGAQDLVIRLAAMTFVGLVAGCVGARRAAASPGLPDASPAGSRSGHVRPDPPGSADPIRSLRTPRPVRRRG
jgi:hypothetical protein